MMPKLRSILRNDRANLGAYLPVLSCPLIGQICSGVTFEGNRLYLDIILRHGDALPKSYYCT